MIEARSIPRAAPTASDSKRRCATLLGSDFHLFRGGAAVRPLAFLIAFIDPYYFAWRRGCETDRLRSVPHPRRHATTSAQQGGPVCVSNHNSQEHTGYGRDFCR